MSDRLISLLDRLGSPNVLVVGDFMLDRYLWGAVDRISPEAPIPVFRIDIGRRDEKPGAAGSVVADLAALGARPLAAGILGRDNNARRLRSLLRALGADTAALLTDPSRPTTLKTRMLARTQQVLRVDEESSAEISAAAARRLSAACVRAVPRMHAVIVQDHAKGVITRQLVQTLVAACRRRGIPLLIDPAPAGDYSKYRGATLLAPNRHEARFASGIEITDQKSAARAAQALIRSLRLQAAVITLDSEGMAVTEARGGTALLPAHALEVFDVTGAGDVVVATLAVALAAHADLLDAARLANVAAGIEVAKLGVATVSKREILERIRGGFESKIKSRADLATIAAESHARGRKIAFTNGCFDLLHIGHVHLLARARKFADSLVVAINSDASARRVKGPGRPIIAEDARAAMLAALECVDYVTVYDEDTPVPLLKLIRPDVIVKGAEYGRDGVVGGKLVESMGGRIESVVMLPGVSTTRIATRAGHGAKKKETGRGYVRQHP